MKTSRKIFAVVLGVVLLFAAIGLSVATISNALNKVIAPGNGSQTAFSFAFVGVAASDVSVIYTTAAGVQTTLVQGPGPTQYQVSLNAAVPPALWGVGGTVTYDPSGTPIPSGSTLTIVRTLPYVQLTSLQNQASFGQLAQATETALDQLEMQIQQLAEAISRVLQAPISDPPGINLTLPPAAQRANTGIAFDSQGNVIAGTTPATGLISSAMQPVVDAASLAAGRTAFGLGSTATTSPNCGLQANVSAAGNLDVNFPTSAVATNQAVTAASCAKVFVATGPITFTMPRANTLWNGFGFWIHVVPGGGNVTVAINANDTVEGQASGVSGTLYPGSWTYVTTNATTFATWYLATTPYPVLDVIAFGAVGDGATNNNTALQRVFTAAAGGGHIRFPCGTFKVTVGLTVTVAEAKNLTIQGSGPDCTVLLVSGAAGPIINYGGFNSSAAVKHMSIVTDGAGANVGLTLNQPFAGTGSNITNNLIDDVVLRGDDASSIPNQHFWNTALSSNGVTNLAITNVFIRGKTTTGIDSAGKGIFLAGFGTQFATVVNIANTSINFTDAALIMGDYIQGVSLYNYNALGNTGIRVPVTNSLNTQALQVTNSQFNTFVCGICIDEVNFTGFALSNTGFIIEPNTVGVKIGGTAELMVVGNVFSGNGATGNKGLQFTGRFGQAGVVASNLFTTLAQGVRLEAAVASPAFISNNQMVNNTIDYSIGAGGGTTIVDAVPRNFVALPTCTANMIYSQLIVVDPNPSPAYNAGVTAGGGALNPIPVVCDGANWHAH